MKWSLVYRVMLWLTSAIIFSMKVSKQEGSIINFLFGLVSGIVSGVVLGLLLAPKTGQEMREEIVHKSHALKDLTKEKLFEFQEASKFKADKVANTFQERASRISNKLDELAKRGSEVLVQDEIQ